MAPDPLNGLYYWPDDNQGPACYTCWLGDSYFGATRGNIVYAIEDTKLEPEEFIISPECMVTWK